MDLTGSGYGTVVEFCDNCDERSGSVKAEQLLISCC